MRKRSNYQRPFNHWGQVISFNNSNRAKIGAILNHFCFSRWAQDQKSSKSARKSCVELQATAGPNRPAQECNIRIYKTVNSSSRRCHSVQLDSSKSIIIKIPFETAKLTPYQGKLPDDWKSQMCSPSSTTERRLTSRSKSQMHRNRQLIFYLESDKLLRENEQNFQPK